MKFDGIHLREILTPNSEVKDRSTDIEELRASHQNTYIFGGGGGH